MQFSQDISLSKTYQEAYNDAIADIVVSLQKMIVNCEDCTFEQIETIQKIKDKIASLRTNHIQVLVLKDLKNLSPLPDCQGFYPGQLNISSSKAFQ